MDGVSELSIMMSIDEQSLGDMFKALQQAAQEVQALNVAFDEMHKVGGEQVKQTQTILALQEDLIKRADMMVRLHKDDTEEMQNVLRTLEGVEVILKGISKEDMELFPGQPAKISTLAGDITRIRKEINGAVDSTSAWAKAFEEVGLGKQYDNLVKFGTLLGQISFWSKMFAENAKQAANWRNQNYQLYGSLQDMASMTRKIATESALLQKEAEAAAKALADVAIDKDSMKAAATTIGLFTLRTGASVEQTAKLAKSWQALGIENASLQKHLDKTENAMAQYGITGKDADVLNKVMADNARLLATGFDDIEEGITKASEQMVIWAGEAKAAGMDMSELSQIFDQLNKDAKKYIVLLGEAIDLEDPGQQFAIMASNAGEWMNIIDGLPKHMRESFSKDMLGVSVKQLSEMTDAFENAAKARGIDTAELQKRIDAGQVSIEQISEEARKERILQDATRSLAGALDYLKQEFVEFITPIVIATAKFTIWVKTLQDTYPTISGIVMWIMKWGMAAVALGVVLKKLMILKFVGWLWSLRSAAKGASTAIESVAKPSLFKKLGQGIRAFIDSFQGAMKSAAAMVVVGAAILIFAGALILMGWGFKTYGADMWYGLIAIIALMAAAAITMSLLAPLGPALIVVAAAFVVFGVALILIATSILIAAHAFSVMAEIPLVQLGTDLLFFGTTSVAAGVLLVAGMAMLSAAMLVGAALIVPGAIFYAASIIMAGGINNIFGALSGREATLEATSKHFYNAMRAINAGSWQIADASWVKFRAGAKILSGGIEQILDAIDSSAVDRLPTFNAEFAKLARLPDEITSSNKMLHMARGISMALWTISNGMRAYAYYVENSAARVSSAIMEVTRSMWLLKLSGLDEMVRTAATVTVKTELEDKQREAEDRAGQTELLEDIKGALGTLTSIVADIIVGGETTAHLEEIRKQVVLWLPEIAEKDKGLATQTNQWGSGLG